MNTEILSADKDPMGRSHSRLPEAGKGGPTESALFDVRGRRNASETSVQKRPGNAGAGAESLAASQGTGAGYRSRSGCHTLALQEKGFTVKAIDISPLSCEAMKLRGVKDAECINLFDRHLSSGNLSEENQENHSGENQEQFEGGFDTILLLMNGTGIAGKIEHLPALFQRLKALLNPGGQILIDSSDLKYIYENEDGSFDINLNGAYYGEVDYQMIYKDVKGDRFDWLYVDFPLLKSIAETCGLHGELVAEGDHYDYLARIF